MRIKSFLALILLMFASFSVTNAQKVLSSQNGFEISYEAKKINAGNKDKWLVTVTAVNKTDNILYYALKTNKQNDGTYAIDILASQFSSKVTVQNATGFLSSDDVKIKGEATKLYTENTNNLLIQYEPGRMYNYENTFNLKSGDTPIVTITHTYPLRKLSEFNVAVSGIITEGDYKTNCGTNLFNITLQQEPTRSILIQVFNGRQIKWIKNSPTSFVKETDSNTTLTYNRERKTFTYNSSDGAVCEWVKF